MIYAKQDARLNGVRAETIFAMIVTAEVYRDLGYDFVITDATSPDHGRGSRHYVGLAFDSRTSHMPVAKRQELGDEVRKRLGPGYDVVLTLRTRGRKVTHLHVEFDPERNVA